MYDEKTYLENSTKENQYLSKEELFDKYKNIPKYICNGMTSYFKGNYHLQQDCLSVAYEALWRAVLNYNSHKGCFDSYIVKCIKMSIWDFLKTEYTHGLSGVNKLKSSALENIEIVRYNPDGGDTVFDMTSITTNIIDGMLDLLKNTSELEQQVLSLMLDGSSNREICDKLHISAKLREEIKEKIHKQLSDFILLEQAS